MPVVDQKMTEAELEHIVCQTIEQLGGEYSGHRPAPNPRGPGAGRKAFDHLKGKKGFPDLFIVCRRRHFVWELKQDKAYLRPDQRAWRDMLVGAGLNYAVIRPREWRSGLVLQALQGEEVELPRN
jgi:hypothetical protein